MTEVTAAHTASPPHVRRARRIIVVGGGVGALETVLALRELVGPEAAVTLVCPDSEFVYQPLAVAEPFDASQARRWSLTELARDLGAELVAETVSGVDPEAKEVTLGDGSRLGYDTLVMAVGARKLAWLDGAVSFRGAADVEAVRAVVAEIEAGEVDSVVFTTPPGTGWPLPVYELALLTAGRVAERRIAGVRISVVSPELRPLSVFGAAASRAMTDLMSDRGIRLHAQRYPVSWDGRKLSLVDGEEIEADRVVTMPRLRGPEIPGLPADAGGFIPTDGHGAVAGLADVYAVGDATAYPIKQGGLAIQQADAAAEAIAADLGLGVEPRPFRPVLRGLLLTGLTPTFLRAELRRTGAAPARVSPDALWWPPSKIAGGHLAGYLAMRADSSRGEGRPDPQAAIAARRELRELALTLADEDARAGEVSSALQWMDVVEKLDADASDGPPSGPGEPGRGLDGLMSATG